MSTEYKDILSSLLPEGPLWRPAEGLGFDQLLKGMGDNEERTRQFLAQLADIRNPDKTIILSDLEKEYGIKTNNNIREADRRAQLAAVMYARRANGSRLFLQDQLQRAGYPLTVYDNAPAADPNKFYYVSQMYCGDTLAQCGEASAQCSSFQAELIVNGNIYETIIDYIVQCGEPLAQCGESTALAGNYSGVTLDPIEYEIPIAGGGTIIVGFFNEEFIDTASVIANGGTIYGSPVIDYGAILDSVSKYITYNYSTSLTELSIICEVDWDIVSGTRQYFVDNAVTSQYFSFALDSSVSPVGKRLQFRSSNGTWISTQGTFIGRHRYAMTLDSSGNLKFYEDGAKLGDTRTGVSLGPSVQNTLTVGRKGASASQGLNGVIYELRLYNYVLTAQEIYEDYTDVETRRQWNMIFFAGGDVLRDEETGEIIRLDYVDIPIRDRKTLKQLILKYKPMHSWCLLAVNWI